MTFSIGAIDRDSGAAGVATVTGGLAVGAFVPGAKTGIGAIATQGTSTNWLYRERGLSLLGDGKSAEQTLQILLHSDEGHEYRQCIIVDAKGDTAGWTGAGCEEARIHLLRFSVAAAGNMLANERVVAAMLDAFEAAEKASLAERLLMALPAGQDIGGDKRGTKSAALFVDFPDRPPIDLRVDYAPGEAVASLNNLYAQYRASPFREFCDTMPTRAEFSRWER